MSDPTVPPPIVPNPDQPAPTNPQPIVPPNPDLPEPVIPEPLPAPVSGRRLGCTNTGGYQANVARPVWMSTSAARS